MYAAGSIEASVYFENSEVRDLVQNNKFLRWQWTGIRKARTYMASRC